MDKVKVSFMVTDEGRPGVLNPNEITERLGLTPSSIIRKGELIPGWKIPARITSWEYKAPLAANQTLSDQLAALRDQLSPFCEEIRRIGQEWRTCISVVIENRGANIEVHLDRTTLQWVCDLGAGFWFDGYTLG